MQGVIGQVVSDSQSGFIPDRLISDNILLATELIKGYTRAHLSPRCMLKIDLNKAYDSIECSFLYSVMIELGFPKTFADWVFTCISTISYSILINGKPSVPFRENKHLQQLKHQPDFNFHPKCEKLSLTHMLFADDLLMFCRADSMSIAYLLDAFNKFSLA
ncbi:uncharacterized protein [Spinacia oleracea]|uniref:Reverse transcriptase domain-containing protein n=1 Tax=Spinacia oleracea TaxID=3562 RepID=A0ABM3R3E9_SPIOL|nr:uncharacterized protein LOC130465420 [Spinacia oleracea]